MKPQQQRAASATPSPSRPQGKRNMHSHPPAAKANSVKRLVGGGALIVLLLSACGPTPTAVVPRSAVPTATSPAVPTATSPAVPTMAATIGPTAIESASGTVATDYLHTWPLPPHCPLSAADGPVCRVSFPRNGGQYQASVDESILFRVGWTDAMKQSCDAFVGNVTANMVIDGKAVSFVTLPCQMFASDPFYNAPPDIPNTLGNQWATDIRYLSPPLSPGTHTTSVTLTYNARVPFWSGCTTTPPCYSAPGEIDAWHQVITVS